MSLPAALQSRLASQAMRKTVDNQELRENDPEEHRGRSVSNDEE